MFPLVREPTIALPALKGLLLGVATVLVAGFAATFVVLKGSSAVRGPEPPGRALRGVIELDPARADRVSPGACVYLAVRLPGEPTAPPLATRRLSALFPLFFEVGIENSMLGQPLPRNVSITARLDADGDPLTRGPDEPTVVLEAGPASGSELRLVLR